MKKTDHEYGQRWVAIGVAISAFILTVCGQSMDPVVTITESSPQSSDYIIRGILTDDVWMNCHVENLPANLMVRWQRAMVDANGRPISIPISIDTAVEDNMKWSIERPTPFSWRLRIRNLEVHDEGNYTCYVRLTGNNNRAEANRTILVTDPPAILRGESSSDTFAREGDMVPLRCNASGRPFPTIMWRREGNNILPGGGVRRMGFLLDIENIQFDARGRYICEAFNEMGTAQRRIMLRVQHTPKMFPDPEKVGQAIGYQRTMRCIVDANPTPSTDQATNQLFWSRANVRIIQSERVYERTIPAAWGRLMYELTIRHVQSDDYGTYRCHARNTLGDGETTIDLYQTDDPQPDRGGMIAGATTHLGSSLLIITTLFITNSLS